MGTSRLLQRLHEDRYRHDLLRRVSYQARFISRELNSRLMEKFRITEITRFVLLNDLIRVFNLYVLFKRFQIL